MSENEKNQESGNQANIENELERIAQDAEAEENQEEAKAGEVITRQEILDADARYQEALKKCLAVMAGVRMGLHKAAPVISFGDKENEFIYTGADKLAHVLKKYDLGDGDSRIMQLIARWQEELDAAVFFAGFGVSAWLQVKEHNAQEAANQANQGGEPGEPGKQIVAVE